MHGGRAAAEQGGEAGSQGSQGARGEKRERERKRERKRERENRAGKRRGLGAGHVSRSDLGQPQAFDLPVTVAVQALRLPAASQGRAEAWVARRSKLPANLQRKRTGLSKSKALRKVGDGLEEALAGLAGFLLAELKTVTSDVVTMSCLNHCTVGGGAVDSLAQLRATLECIQQVGLLEDIQQVVLKPWLTLASHSSTAEETAIVTEILEEDKPVETSRFCWAAANFLSAPAGVDAALPQALHSAVHACDDGYIMRDLREEPRAQLTTQLASAAAMNMTAAQRVQVAAQVAKKSQRLKAAKTDGTSQLLRQLVEHGQSGAALPLAHLPRTGREEAAQRHASALGHFAGDVDIAEDLRLDPHFMGWLQRLCRAADLPLDSSGAARLAILSVVRENAVGHDRFATAFEEFLDNVGLPIPRVGEPCQPWRKGERAVYSRKSDELKPTDVPVRSLCIA